VLFQIVLVNISDVVMASFVPRLCCRLRHSAIGPIYVCRCVLIELAVGCCLLANLEILLIHCLEVHLCSARLCFNVLTIVSATLRQR